MHLMWSRASDEAPSRDTADPLGLHAAEVAVAELLVPGFSGATAHARSLALLLGGLVLVGPEAEGQTRFDRFDRMSVHAVAMEEALPTERVLSTAGIKEARRLRETRHHRALIDLDEHLGKYGRGPASVYRGLAGVLGLLNDWTPTPTGVALGEAALAGVDRVATLADLERGRVGPDLLRAMNLPRPCLAKEKKLIRKALEGFQSPEGTRPFVRLAGSGKGRLDRRRLLAGQRVVLQAAEHLAELVEKVENPFRAQVGTFNPASIKGHRTLSKSLGEVLGVLESRAPGSRPGLVGLLGVLRASGDFDALFAHHRRLMAARGIPPWEWPREPRGPEPVEVDEESDGSAGQGLPAAVQARLSALSRMVGQVGGLA